MIEVFSLLVEAIVGLVSAAIQLVGLLLESLGFATGTLASKPKEGEARFSATRVASAFLPFAMILVILSCSWLFFAWRQKVRNARIAETRESVSHMLDAITADRTEDGRTVWPPVCVLLESDPWSRMFVLERVEGPMN